MEREYIKALIQEAVDTALFQFYYELEQETGREYTRDITPGQSFLWDQAINQFADLFKSLAIQNVVSKASEKLLEETKELVFSVGGNEEDFEQISDEIRINGYTTIEEVQKHLENFYLDIG